MTPGIQLTPNTTYTWWIQAWNDSGYGIWSEGCEFFIEQVNPVTADYSGRWQGNWYSGAWSPENGGLMFNFTQSDKVIAGTIALANTDCGTLQNIPISCLLEENKILITTSYRCDGDMEVQIEGTFESDTLSGKYRQYLSGSLYDYGIFSTTME